MQTHLVHHSNVGFGHARYDESIDRWKVRFFTYYAVPKVFTDKCFKQGYLKDCGIVKIEEHNEQF